MDSYDSRRIPGDGKLADAFEVRRAVFIEGQDVPESIEMDGKDDEAVHFVVRDGDRPVGTARLRMPESETAKPERVAVLEAYREQGIGRRLMELIESEARKQGCSRAVLHAQTHVVEFYETLGYEVTSGEFEEAGIPHVEMEKQF